MQLRRILSAAPFLNSSVLMHFLNFVVSETLAGRSNTLKEYTIGIQALNKEADFNPQSNAIVRIHAGRLRRALEEYYLGLGKNDPIIIEIPKGGYAPIFTFKTYRETKALSEPSHEEPFNSSPDAQATPYPTAPPITLLDKPIIEILPFKNITAQKEVKFFVRRLTEFLAEELTHFRNVKVLTQGCDLAPSSSALQPPSSTPDFTLAGSVQWITRRIRVWVRLTHFQTQEQLWAHTFEQPISLESYWEFQEEIVSQALAEIMGIDGILSRFYIEKTDSQKPVERTSYPLHYWYYHLIKTFDLHTLHRAKHAYTEIVKNDPNNSLACAYLSHVCAIEKVLNNVGFEKGFDEGLVYGQMSLKLDPLCQEGYKALAANQMMREHYNDTSQLLEHGIHINPRSNDYKAFMGAALIYSGFYERGKELLDEAFRRDPYLPPWQVLAFAYYAFNLGHYQDTIFWTERIGTATEKVSILKAASYALLENDSLAFDVLLEHREVSIEKLLDLDRLHSLFTPYTFALQVGEGLKRLIQYQSARVVGITHF